MDLQPNLLLFLELGLSLRSIRVCNLFFQNYLKIRRFKGVKGKNKIGAARNFLIFDFLFQIKFFFCLLPQVSKHSMS